MHENEMRLKIALIIEIMISKFKKSGNSFIDEFNISIIAKYIDDNFMNSRFKIDRIKGFKLYAKLGRKINETT